MSDIKRKRRGINPKLRSSSGLASFIARPLPKEEEVADFEKAIHRELRDQEIDSHLSDVYSDKKGGVVDVSRMNIKKRPHILKRIFKNLFFLALIAFAAYYAYNNYFANNNDISSLNLELIAPERIVAGEDFFYEIKYSNPSKYVFSDVNLEIQYPENFVFEEASLDSVLISPVSGNYGFNLPDIAPGATLSLMVKGYLLNSPDSVNLAIARLSYMPGSFSSHFKKESSASTIINNLGFLVDVESSSSVFLGQENEINIFISSVDKKDLGDVLNDFDIFFNFKDASGAELLSATSSLAANTNNGSIASRSLILEKLSAFSWHLSGLEDGTERQKLSFKYRVKKKIDDFEIEIAFRKKIAEKNLVFWREIIKPELVSSDLSLSLILNASKNDQALDFGSNLNYTLTYSNQGTKSYEDVVIMAVLESDLLDWNTISTEQNGEVGAATISWTKNELPQLSEIKAGMKGELNFSIKLKDFNPEFLGQQLQVISYAQYSVSGQEAGEGNNMSNKIVSPLNSDLRLNESLRYFDENNYPVGSGPLPPKVGEITEFRVFWDIENNVHELRELRIVYNLPTHVSFVGKENYNVGNLYYDDSSRQVIWDIGFLPSSQYFVDAAFSLSIQPAEEDRNKILVLSPGSIVSAIDTETGSIINKKTKPKTSRLEDDEIVEMMSNSGRVE